MPHTRLHPKWLRPDLPREGRYVLGPLLGRGGMGEVVEAWDVVLCRTVALKSLRNLDAPAMIRFVHEAQIQARVVHPNICRIYDIETGDGALRIAMQLIRGPSLEQAARQLAVNEVVGVLAQVAEAVHAAHRLHLIHRDLKPSNILLERDGDGRWTPYICDFGLALALDEPALSLGQAILGTPAYMAPEQMEGDRDRISPATDVYALGGTLHFCLLGHPPGLLGAKALGTPRPGLPDDLNLILDTALDPDPGRRYATAAALAEDLWRFLNREPLHPPRSGPSGPVPGRTRTWKTVVLAAGVLGIAAGGLALAQGRRLQRERAAEAVGSAILQDLEQAVAAYRTEEAAPPHDLRPARARLRAFAEAAQAQARQAGSPSRDEGWYAIGRCRMLLGDYAGAAQALGESAEAGGQGRALRKLQHEAHLGWALESLGPPPPEWTDPDRTYGLAPLRGLLHEVASGDFEAAARSRAQLAGTFLEPRGWATLVGLGLARQRFRMGDFPGSEAALAEAIAWGRRTLASLRSSLSAHRALARALAGRAELRLERGEPAVQDLADLEACVRQGLLLDPGDPRLQETLLVWHLLRARHLALAGGADQEAVEAALAYLDTGVQDPSRPAARGLRMALNLQLAQARLRQGRDPWPPLVEALRTVEPLPFLLRDPLPDAFLFKAGLEAARDEDPRPTLADGLERLRQEPASWPAREAEARFWLARAEFERRRGLDDGASLDAAEAAANLALRMAPGAARPSAAKALALARRMEREPARAPSLAPAVRASARAGLAAPLDPKGRRRLAHLAGGNP